MKNQAKLDYLKKFNVNLDASTKQAVLEGIITVRDILDMYGKDCCDWVVIVKPDKEYTLEEREFFDKYIQSTLEIGQERDVVIDYTEDENEITVQVKHKDLWNDLQHDIGYVDNWYGYYLKYSKLKI